MPASIPRVRRVRVPRPAISLSPEPPVGANAPDKATLPIVDVAAYDLLENHVASGADQHRPGHLSPKTHQESSGGGQSNTPEGLPREHVADVAVPQVSGVNSASELAHLGISDGSEA